MNIYRTDSKFERIDYKVLTIQSFDNRYSHRMYIIELFIKWLEKNKRGKRANPENNFQEGVIINRDGERINEPEDEALTCIHNFMPIDSTNEVLACTKCGFVIKKR